MSEPLSQSEAIARELEALGEAPLSAEELAMLGRDESDQLDHLDRFDHEPAVASTARLIELSRPYESADLSELDKQRVWRKVEQRRATASVVAGPSEPPAVEAPGRGWAPWIGVALAIAAAAVMLVMLPSDESSPTGPSATEVAEVGEHARSALRALDDGLSDTARAEQMSRDYQRRLEAKP